MIRECVNLALHARVVDKDIAVKIVKLKGVLFQSGALKECGNISFDKDRFLEGYQSLETLDKKHYISIINVFAHKHYLAFFMRLIEIRIEVAKIRLIPPFGGL